MDNPTRSERSRKAALEAALTIIARDGAGRLTLDAIARESGISKGGVMHHFKTKEAVLKALLQLHAEQFEAFSRRFMATEGATHPEPLLAVEIATSRELISTPHSVAFAILGAVVQEPSLLDFSREIDVKKLKAIKAEAADPQLATLRWAAGRGLALTRMLGICPIPDKECQQLFERLLDDRQWPSGAAPQKKRAAPKSGTKKPPAKKTASR